MISGSQSIRSLVQALLRVVLLLGLVWSAPALAQTRYTNTTDGAISETATPCTTPLVRNFTVAAGTVTDVNLGVLLGHTRRADLRITLQSPIGTRVVVMNATGGGADNLNVLFDDANSTAISAHTSNDTATAATVVPPYQRTGIYAPANPLSAFNGQSAGGTWRLEVCDQTGGNTGTFFQADLYITTGTLTVADLSLAMTVNTPAPLRGAEVSYTLTIASAAASGGTASGVQVRSVLPANLVFRSASGTGTYDSATGIWAVGSLAPGATASITIFAANNSTSGTTFSTTAEITASSLPDPDSVPNNAATGEDDYAAANLTTAALPPAGTPPAFTCSAGSNLFDWDAQSWTTGALSGSFTVAGVPMSLAIGGATSRLIADPVTTSQTPVRNTSTTNSGNGNTLMLAIDLATTSETVTATWSFTNGVAGLRFTLADIDYFYGQFSDRVTVTGSYLGNPVTPVLTAGQSNSVSGNTAIATALVDNASAGGNVIVTFAQPVDTVIVTYGADATKSPANPGIQAIALMDMTFCNRATDLSLSKTVSNASPNSGSAISYTLTLANNTPQAMTVSGITVRDVLPAGFTFGSASGTGTYNNTTGIWTVGTVAAGATASLTISGTASGVIGSTVTNVAEITASSLPDIDSTVNNGATGEDDYAAVSFTISGTITCPAGSTGTGSGFASSGSGANLNRIFWLDWSCGSTTSFPAGSTVNKTWNAGDGLVLTGQVSAITAALRPYVTGSWGGDLLDDLYAGVNPIGLRNNVEGQDAQFTLTISATLNGNPVNLRYVLADAEDSGGSVADESITASTNGSAWSQLETAGSITVANGGSSVTISDPANGGGGTAIMETIGGTVAMTVNMMTVGGTSAAFGFHAPFDFSDGPTTGTSYGAANHRTIPSFRMGSTVTSEASAFNDPLASADAGDDGVTLPELVRGQTVAIPVTVSPGGFLNAWIDFNDDGDFADAGEQIATNAVDGGAGDSDGLANGTIRLAVNVPATAATTPTIARFRYASVSGASISGLFGFGEVEDYALAVLTPGISVTKVSSVLSDPVNGTSPARMAIPGALIEYCIQISNTGSATATSVVATDNLPASTTYVAGSMTSGATCALATTAEDDDASGADESDPFGAAVSGATLTATIGTLNAGTGHAIKFRAIVN